jgi:hypothetical protein
MTTRLAWLILACVMGHASLVEAKTMYVRPYADCTNNGDGTAYACAASPGGVGAYKALGSVAWGAGAAQVSNGDTLYVCGFHDRGNNVAIPDNALTPTTNAIIDGACPSDAGSILGANQQFTSGWTGPDAFGAYTQVDGGCSSMHMAQLVDGVPTRLPYPKTGVPDGTWAEGSFYDDCGGNKYVKPLGGVSANAATLYMTWVNIITLTNVAVTVQNLTIYGLSNDACIILTNADDSVITGNTIKWCREMAISLNSASDRVRITDNTITYSGNGIYFESILDATNSNYAIVTGNTLTDIDQDRYYNRTDNQVFAIQGGDFNYFANNTVARYAQDCAVFFTEPGQSLKNLRFVNNTCSTQHDTSGQAGMYASGGIVNSSINAAHVANNVVNNIVAGNVLTDIDGYCFWAKSSHATVGKDWIWANNLAINCGTGLMMEDAENGDLGFVFKNNILYNATTNIDHEQSGSETLTNVVINNNIYSTDGATSFEWNGTKSAFAAWKTNSSQDAASYQVDPSFLNDETDFRLKSASSGRSTGACWFGGVAAKDVRSRPFNCPPDIGSYQSSSGDPAATRAVRN